MLIILLVIPANLRYYADGRQSMLDTGLIIAAIGLRLAAGLHYFVATSKGKVQPNPITWLFWGLAPLVAFFAQIQAGASENAWTTLALAIGPLSIFVAALLVERRKRWHISRFDFGCGTLAVAGIILWQITANPSVAIVFGILADIAGGIPTVIKSYRAPRSERALPYFLSILSMILTLASLKEWTFIHSAFPIYILGINVLLFSLIASAPLSSKRRVLGQSKSTN